MLRTLTFCCSMIVLIALAGREAPANHSRLSPSRCAPVDSESDNFKGYIISLMREKAPEWVKLRRDVHLVPVDSTSVQQITVDSLCRMAAELITAYDSEPAGISRNVYLMKVGSIRMAEDLNNHAGEWVPVYTMDSSLTKVYASILQ